jgi:hypothetical protein
MKRLTLLLLAALGACSPIYIPNAPTTAMPKDAGDTHIAISIGTHGLDGSVAIAANDHTVVVAAGSYKGGGEKLDYTRHKYGELLAGWYSPLSFGSVVLLAGGGAGISSASCTDFGFSEISCDNMVRSGSFTRYIVQANIGAIADEKRVPATSPDSPRRTPITGRPFKHRDEFGLATRIALVQFPNLEERSYTFDTVTHNPTVSAPTWRPVTGLFLEPTLFGRWVSGRFGMEGQCSFSFPILNKGDIPIEYLNLSFGIFLRFE